MPICPLNTLQSPNLVFLCVIAHLVSKTIPSDFLYLRDKSDLLLKRLGYTFGPQYSFGSGQGYLAAYPSAKSLHRLKQKLRRMTDCRMTWQAVENVVRDVNRVVRGWVNYFSYGTLWKKYLVLEQFLLQRLRGWLVRKHKVDSRGECRFPPAYLHNRLGLVNPAHVLSRPRMS